MRRFALALALWGAGVPCLSPLAAQFERRTVQVARFEIVDPTIATNFEDPDDSKKALIATAIERRFLNAIRFLERPADDAEDAADYQLVVTVEAREVPEVARPDTDLGLSVLRFELQHGAERVRSAELPFLGGVDYLFAGDPERLARFIDERLWRLFSQGKNLDQLQALLSSIPIAEEVHVVEVPELQDGSSTGDQLFCILPFSLGSIGALPQTEFEIVVRDELSAPHALRLQGYQPAADTPYYGLIAPRQGSPGPAFARILETAADRADAQPAPLTTAQLLAQLKRGVEPVELDGHTVRARRAATELTVADYRFVVPPRAILPSEVKP